MRYYAVPRKYRPIAAHRPVEFNGGRRLPVDVQLKDDVFEVTASVPGLSVDDIRIEILDDVLTLSGELAEEDPEGTYLLREVQSGSFARQLRFPVPVDSSAAKAVVENGLLKVSVPKAEEAKPKVIKIKAA